MAEEVFASLTRQVSVIMLPNVSILPSGGEIHVMFDQPYSSNVITSVTFVLLEVSLA